MRRLRFGDTIPAGRLRASIKADMEGCIGHLDELAPEIFLRQDIYGKDRLTANSKQAELGRIPDDKPEIKIKEVPEQFMWWNSESQSNWRDGFCRGALLLNEKEWTDKVIAYVGTILATQDPDGYLGIYQNDTRYRHTTENGELWAKSTLFRALLGCYEFTGDERILQAVRAAADELMRGYPMGNCDPFRVEGSFAGHCHGLTITDALFELHRLTGERIYLDYAVWLYENYSTNRVSEEDMQEKSLKDFDYRWKNHGVHTYEHLRSVIVAAYGDEKKRELVLRMLAKLPYYLTPSGGPIGDEWIGGRTASASTTGYEFCSVLELFDAYALLLELTGDPAWADRMEWLYFNAGMGMKHPNQSSIMYCKTDNCYTADRKKFPEYEGKDERYKYSPTHQTTAVCCVPNMGRLTPHYVGQMYYRDEDGLYAALFGECTANESFGGKNVTIIQRTDYPNSLSISFQVSAPESVRFALRVRKPRWAKEWNSEQPFEEQGGWLMLDREWSGTMSVRLAFECEPEIHTDFQMDRYFSFGPLVYALPISAEEKIGSGFSLGGFQEVVYTAKDLSARNVKTVDDEHMVAIHQASEDGDWKKQILILPLLRDGRVEMTTLYPMGGTILRKVTFERGV